MRKFISYRLWFDTPTDDWDSKELTCFFFLGVVVKYTNLNGGFFFEAGSLDGILCMIATFGNFLFPVVLTVGWLE